MAPKIKCTNCGGLDLVPYRLYGESTFVIWNSNAQTMACKTCGHLELYVDVKIFESQQPKPEEDPEYLKKVAEYEAKKAELYKEIDAVRKIVGDIKQTERAVDEAEAKLLRLEDQLRTLRAPSKDTAESDESGDKND